MSFFRDLRRRNVFRVAAAYIVTAWLVIQVVETIMPAFGFGDAAVRLVTLLSAIGFLPALVISWAFEWTPEGLRRESDVSPSGPVTRQSGKRLDRIIIVVLTLALAYFAFNQLVLGPQREAALEARQAAAIEQARQDARSEAVAARSAEKSIAVLPFVNMSSDAEQDYFSDGISEELINLLTKIPELRVIARTSAFYYKGKDIKLSQVAEELSVSHVLEGSVRKADDRVRITAQLVEADTEAHLWSETYDRTLADIFAVQDEIAASVVEQLRLKLLGDTPKARTVDPEAYALWLQGNHLLREWNIHSVAQARGLFEKALAIQPDFIDARFGLAELHKGDENYRRALDEILQIDPGYANAYARLGGLAILDFDLEASAANMQRALELAPTSTFVLESATWLSIVLGRFDEALEVYRYLAARDPLNHLAYGYSGTVLLAKGQPDKALEAFATAQRIRPGSATEWGLSQAYLFMGDARAALDIAYGHEEDIDLYPGVFLSVSSMALHTLGRSGEAQDVLTQLTGLYGDALPELVAMVHAWTGDADSCFAWLNRGVDQRRIVDIYLNHAFASIREDPRWMDFLRRIGRTPEQQAAVEFHIPLPR